MDGKENLENLEMTLKEKKRQEIFYKGYFYDVTDFISRHPGGNVIKFYTALGEDATQAIEQFHFRSMTRVRGILKSLNRRPAIPEERGLDPKALSRHEALSADFEKLYEELKEEGYFEPSIPHVILRILDGIILLLFGWAIFFQCETIPGKFLSTILLGFGYSRYGWLEHEGFLMGGSSAWWNSQHNRHHAMPQRLHHDVDLASLPFVAFHKRAVKDPNQINSFFIKYQAVFYWTLDLLLVTIAWRFFLHPRYQFQRKLYHELIYGIPVNLFALFVVGPWYFLITYWFAFFLSINFALNHSHLEVADKPTHWVEYSLTHTANIQPSMFVDYFMGYLNYQIEHHLFPTIPQFKHKEICPRVKALAEKHGLQYRVFSYTEACVLAVKNLNDVGRELTGTKYFAKKE